MELDKSQDYSSSSSVLLFSEMPPSPTICINKLLRLLRDI